MQQWQAPAAGLRLRTTQKWPHMLKSDHRGLSDSKVKFRWVGGWWVVVWMIIVTRLDLVNCLFFLRKLIKSFVLSNIHFQINRLKTVEIRYLLKWTLFCEKRRKKSFKYIYYYFILWTKMELIQSFVQSKIYFQKIQ